MLTDLHRFARRHRRALVGVIVLFTLAVAGATFHAAAMSAHGHGLQVSDAVLACVAIGGTLAITVGVACAVRRVGPRPLWRLADPAPPADPVRLAVAQWRVRAGPPERLQVFRL